MKPAVETHSSPLMSKVEKSRLRERRKSLDLKDAAHPSDIGKFGFLMV